MNKRFWIIGLACSGLLLLIVVLFFVLTRQSETTPELTAEELQQLEIDTIIQSSYQKILFASTQKNNRTTTSSVHLAAIDSPASIALIHDVELSAVSNIVGDDPTWFTIENNTIIQHTISSNDVIGATEYPIKSDTNDRLNLAVNSDLTYLAWITPSNTLVLRYLETGEEQIVYGESTEQLAELTSVSWSPDNNEIAVIADHNKIITLDTTGVQLTSPIAIANVRFEQVSWIEPTHLAVVATSDPINPTPFEPKIMVVDRYSTIIEEHLIANSIGMPFVMWSVDGKYFLYYHPWKQSIIMFDRFDSVVSIINANVSGTLLPLGITTGELPLAPAADTINLNTNIHTSPNNTNTTQSFTVSGEEWEEYNGIIRAILNQFKVDFSTYRFSTTNEGIAIAITTSEPDSAAMTLQVLLQSFVALPKVPNITLNVTTNNQEISVRNINREQAEQLSQQFALKSLSELFTITVEQPQGVVTPKTDNPNQSYFGEIIYPGDHYNPVPALAYLNANHNNGQSLLWLAQYSFEYPENWLWKDRGTTVGEPYHAGDLVLYDATTEFISESAWKGFAVDIRSYAVPDITLDQWLQVNRNGSVIEDANLILHYPLAGKHVITGNSFSDEYALQANNTIYVIRMESNLDLTEDNKTQLKNIVSSFSDHASLNLIP